MSAHRRLSTDDGGETCYACGAYAESHDGLSAVDCTGPSTEHPPYLLADGTVETCAAHPYSDCERAADAVRDARVMPENPGLYDSSALAIEAGYRGDPPETECCGMPADGPCAQWCVNAPPRAGRVGRGYLLVRRAAIIRAQLQAERGRMP